MRNARWMAVCACGIAACAAGQTQVPKVSFTGAGRFLLQHDALGGSLAEGDTVTPGRVMSGAAVFDFGVIARPDASTEVVAVTRVTSSLDGFWGQGVGFGVRELYARGLIRGVVRYRMGDLDLRLTPMTLANDNVDLGGVHPEMVRVWSDWIDYDRFYRGGMWRQQGIDADAVLAVRPFDEVAVRGILAKNRGTDYFFTPDRLLGAWEAVGTRDSLRIGYRGVSLFDVASTAQFSEAAGTTTVHTLDGKGPLAGGWSWSAEAGVSRRSYEGISGAPEPELAEVGELWTRRRGGAGSWGFGVRHVASGFRSPGAQSRRTDFGASAAVWPFVTNREVVRMLTPADLLQDPGVYRAAIAPGLQSYSPIYQAVAPYGAATPNRQTLTTTYSRGTVTVEAALAREAVGEGIAERRRMASLQATGSHTVPASGKPLRIDGLLRAERTARPGLSDLGPGFDGIGEVDWACGRAELGLQWEPEPDAALHAAVLAVAARGTDYLAERDVYDRIVDFRRFETTYTAWLATAGAMYRFTPSSRLNVQYRMQWVDDAEAPGTFAWSQWSFLYTLYF